MAGSAAAGVIYVARSAPTATRAAVAAFVAALREALARGGGRPARLRAVPDSPPVLASAVVVHAPPRGAGAWSDLWGPVPGLPLMRAVKDQFDPGHRMAPGRFAGGI